MDHDCLACFRLSLTLLWSLGIRSSCRWASGNFARVAYFCESEVPNSSPKWNTTVAVWVSPHSSDVWISASGPAGRLLGSGKQLSTQAEPIHCAELYWSVTVTEGGERERRERPKDRSHPPPCHLFSTVRKRLHLVAEQIQGEERNGLLGTEAFTVTWEERETLRITDGVWRYIQHGIWSRRWHFYQVQSKAFCKTGQVRAVVHTASMWWPRHDPPHCSDSD